MKSGAWFSERVAFKTFFGAKARAITGSGSFPYDPCSRQPRYRVSSSGHSVSCVSTGNPACLGPGARAGPLSLRGGLGGRCLLLTQAHGAGGKYNCNSDLGIDANETLVVKYSPASRTLSLGAEVCHVAQVCCLILSSKGSFTLFQGLFQDGFSRICQWQMCLGMLSQRVACALS